MRYDKIDLERDRLMTLLRSSIREQWATVAMKVVPVIVALVVTLGWGAKSSLAAMGAALGLLASGALETYYRSALAKRAETHSSFISRASSEDIEAIGEATNVEELLKGIEKLKSRGARKEG